MGLGDLIREITGNGDRDEYGLRTDKEIPPERARRSNKKLAEREAKRRQSKWTGFTGFGPHGR